MINGSIDTLTTLPLRAFQGGVGLARVALRGAAEILLPSTTDCQVEFAKQLSAEHILDKAERAQDLVRIGVESGISTIKFDGRAKLGELAILAEDSPHVPAGTTFAVVDMAVQAGVDTHFEPLLTDGSQKKFEDVFNKFDNVKRLRRVKPNKL